MLRELSITKLEKRTTFFFLLYLFAHQSIAFQTTDSTRSIVLDNVVITENYLQEFTKASKVISIDPSVADYFKPFSELWGENSSIYFKNYGNGQLSSISLRGTSAGHTATLWNGLNINYPSLGQFDFSLFSLSQSQNTNIFLGGSSSLFGSDALGGSVVINADPNMKEGLSLTQQIGSFSTFRTGIVYGFKSSKLISNTSLVYTSSLNNFSFENYTKPGSPVEQQDNAAFESWGLIQDLFYSINKNSTLALNLWFNQADREIQPTITNVQAEDTQFDQSIRLNLGFDHTLDNNNYLKINIASLRDEIRFNETQPTTSYQHIASAEYGGSIIPNLTFKTGGNIRNYSLEGSNYDPDPRESRSDIYGWLVYSPVNKLSLGLNLRQSFYPGDLNPFAPSITVNWNILKSIKSDLILKSVTSRNFRLPTINDRYWQPGGNPEINPESGWSTELGFNYSFNEENIRLETEITGYRMWMTDLIVWLPTGNFWSPRNFRDVDFYGVELAASLFIQLNRESNLRLYGSYFLTRSINQSSLDEFDRSEGKQLPYTPIHNASFAQEATAKGWVLKMTQNYTGEQFVTTDNETALNPFFLFNVSLGKSIFLSKIELNISVESRNITNTQYQQILHRAMPGRNYLLSIQIKL